MQRITSKLTRVLVITLLTATLATAGSLTLKASGVMPQGAPPIPPMPWCDKWFAAHRQNSPDAYAFISGCSKELADRGSAIENQYPWAANARNLLPNAHAQRGFDIGMAAAEGNTANGPGKDAIRDALNFEEQGGYTSAVARSLEWNLDAPRRLAILEVKGAELASQDQEASVLLNQQPNASARRGFDIGMGAAEGNTQRGPLKDGIRASLKPEERGGFDDAISYSLTHNKILASKGSAAATGGANMPSGDPSAAKGADMASGDSSPADLGNRPPGRPIVPRGNDSRNLRATLENLRHAREYLEAANPDADGHLEKAIDYTNKAIEELRKALAGSQ